MIRSVHITIILVFIFLVLPSMGNLNEKTIQEIDYKLGLVRINYNHELMTTGFFINNDGLIMTVAHGLPKGLFLKFAKIYPIYVSPMDTENIYEAEIIALAQNRDIMLLKIDKYDVKVFFDKFEQPIEGEHVTVVGFPTMEWYAEKEGKIIFNDLRGWVGVDEGLAGGSSGSPVFDDENNIVGMVHELDKRVDFTILVSGNILSVFLTSYYDLAAQKNANRFLR